MMYDVILHYPFGDVFVPVIGVAEANMVEDIYKDECEVTIQPRVDLYLNRTNRPMAKRLRLVKGVYHG